MLRGKRKTRSNVVGEQPLAGVTVLDLGQIYNGPYCGYLLAMAGARVIKVESPRGEGLRGGAGGQPGYAFAMLNGNKETITLNLKSEAGRGILIELAKRADALLENFAPGAMARLGVGSDVLLKANPRLIYAAGTGFGGTGPHRDYLAMDVTVQAMSGVISITGNEGEPPLKSGPALCDILGGVHLCAAIVAALYRRERTGAGAVLDVAMQDAVFPTLISALGAYYALGGNPPRTGNRHQALGVAPYNVYAAADGHVAILCIREGHWRKLIRAMGRPQLADDPRFANMAARCKHMDETDAAVEAWTASLSCDEAFRICQAHEVICAPVRSLHDVVNDPHLLARGALRKVAHPRFGEVALFGTPLRFADVTPPTPVLPRGLGEDTAAVLDEFLGCGAAELERLRESGAI